MGIHKWRDRRGKEKIYLSKQWPDGMRFRRVIPNRTIAKQLEARIDNAVVMGTWRSLREELVSGYRREANPTVADFAHDYLEYCRSRNRRPDFKEQALVAITRIVGDVPLKAFTRSQADRFVQARTREGVKPATINRGLAVLKHLLALAEERGHLDRHPLGRYRMLREVQEPLRILTYAEYRRLIEVVGQEDLVMGAYTAVLGETGMRKSEGLRLRWDHIRKAERVVLIGRTKSGKMRSVPLSDLALEWLEKLVRFIDIPEVFVNPETCRPWKDPRGPFDRARLRAGLNSVGFHDLRHFRATQWLMRGLDVNTVKELLGHADIQTTMRYVHYVDSHATRSVKAAQKAELHEWQNGHLALDENWTTGP